MHNQPYRLMVCLLLLCAGIACMAGCLNQDDTGLSGNDISVIPAGQDYPEYAGTYEKGSLRITVPVFEQHWTAEGTCYWEGRIQVENTGAEPMKNVKIRSSLIDMESGEPVDTKWEEYTKFGANNTITFVVKLNGECDGQYTIQVETFVD